MSERVMPEGWVETTLGALTSFQGGKTPSKSNPLFWDGGTIHWVSPKDMKSAVIKDTIDKISRSALDAGGMRLYPRGSVLLVTRSGILRHSFPVALADVEVTVNQDLKVVEPLDGLLPSYLAYYLRASSQEILSACSKAGTTVNSIDLVSLEKFSVPLVSQKEQRAIVDKLDEMLAQVNNLKARLDTIPAILKKFRQSVLAAAVRGKLTEHKYKRKELSRNSFLLKDFVSIDVGSAFKSSEFSESGMRLLRGANIEPGRLRWSETKFYPKNKLEGLEHLYIQEGDLILAMDRPIVSSGLKLARARKEDLPCVLVQRVARFKDYKGLLPSYLMILLQRNDFSNYLKEGQTGSDIPHVSGSQVLSYEVVVPDEDEQLEIVRRVDQLFAFADQIEQQVKNAQARVNKLTQSILAKAFRGELTAEWRAANPELISGENSAEALLERIKAEKAKQKPAGKGRSSLLPAH